MNEVIEQTETEKCRAIFSHLCHDLGLLDYRIKQMEGDRESLLVKLRNAALDFEKAKAAEPKTIPHIEAVTNPQEQQ